jgi:hypothetical protein
MNTRKLLTIVGIALVSIVTTCIVLFIVYGDDCPCHHAVYYVFDIDVPGHKHHQVPY